VARAPPGRLRLLTLVDDDMRSSSGSTSSVVHASRYTGSCDQIVRRQVGSAESLDDLRVPPGIRLEALKGDRVGQHRIRVDDQWRICFVWTDAGPEEVEIVDYH
jgi:proteic killer suppression protein